MQKLAVRSEKKKAPCRERGHLARSSIINEKRRRNHEGHEGSRREEELEKRRNAEIRRQK